jgi:putative SOS response-associated peptidase YedK
MCNLYTQTRSVDEVARLFRTLQVPLRFPEGAPNLEPREIAITDPAPIVRLGGEAEPGPELVVRRWSWPGAHGKPVFNFRSDGRQFGGSSRCLILADGFFEFTKPADPAQKRKHKWRFTLAGSPIFALAGLWRTDPAVGEAFTMLTTEPGADMKPYHNRQVVVLPPVEFARWLNPAVPAAELCQPLPAGSLDVEQVA